MGNWIRTVTGGRFDLTSPTPDMVDIEEIAYALSLINRYTGHTRRPLNVAEHSVLMSRVVPKEHAFAALLHDAPEAYIGDISRPLKLEIGPIIKVIEARVEAVVAEAFGLEAGFSQREAIKDADSRMIVTEARQLLPGGTEGWGFGLDEMEPFDMEIECWTPLKARGEFITRFVELTDVRNSAA